MNRKGFTLIELLTVIVLLSILSSFLIINVTTILDNTKKEAFLSDAQKLISLAEAKVLKDYNIRASGNYTFTFDELNENEILENDPDGNEYNSSSFVKYTIENNNMRYCVTLIGSRRSIGKNSCVYKEDLKNIDKVINNS